VRAALEIVQAVKSVPAEPPLSVHIGVATGTVVVGEASRPGEEAVGGMPNLAARLQGLAGPDEIVIAPTTRRLLGNAFDLIDLGAQQLKGFNEPVRPWRVVRVSDAATRFEASHGEQLTPLVGREWEIDLLLHRQQRAQAGAGQVVCISGEPGIGKSRLLNELCKRLVAQGVQPLRFQCSPYYVNHAFWPFIDHFQRALKFARDEAAESKLDKLESLIVGEYGRPLNDVRFIASMLSIPCESRYGRLKMVPQKHKDETLRTLVDIAEAAARKQPSVVLFEDVHWVDATTLEVLDLLLDRMKGIPLLAALTHRPEFQNRWASDQHVAAINLTKLTRVESATMVSRLAGTKALPDQLVEEILTKTEGVPLFLEELTKSILESGELMETGDRYEYIGPSRSPTVPLTLRDSLMARLDRNKSAKEIAQVGAAIGREFSYELLSAVARRPEPELTDALEHLTVSGLAVQRGALPEATYSFKHALVQDAAYDSLLKRRRQELHRDIARVIEESLPKTKDTEPEVLAHHYTRGELFEVGADYWIKAGHNALSRMALKEALAHLGAEYVDDTNCSNGEKDERTGLGVVRLLPASKARDRLELECRVLLSTAWEALDGWASPKLPSVLMPALPLARASGDPKLLARTLWGLWVQLMSVGPVAESLKWAEELLSAGEKMADEELLLVGHMAVMVTNFWLGNVRAVKRHAYAILERYDRDRHAHIVKSMNHDPKTLAGIYLAQVLWMLGYPDQAAAIVDERDAHAHLIGHPFDFGFVLTLGAWVFHYRREPEKLLARTTAVRELAQEASLPFLSETLLPYLSTGISLVQKQRLAEAIEQLERGIKRWEAVGAKAVTPYIRSRLGEALALSGDVDAGLSHVNAMLEQIALPGWEERSHYAEILRLKGWMLSLKGDLAGAEDGYRASLDWAREQHAKSWELRTANSLARLLQSMGKVKEAHDLLAPIYDWFTEGFDTRDLMEAKSLLAELKPSLNGSNGSSGSRSQPLEHWEDSQAPSAQSPI
jgi:tetratricopeptide (TPR) repeat protein